MDGFGVIPNFLKHGGLGTRVTHGNGSDSRNPGQTFLQNFHLAFKLIGREIFPLTLECSVYRFQGENACFRISKSREEREGSDIGGHTNDVFFQVRVSLTKKVAIVHY